MSLYLCIFTEDGEDEIAGWQLGAYSDFALFRDTIAKHLREGDFPTLMTHSDCSGEWSVEELPQLIHELQTISATFRTLPPEEKTPGGGNTLWSKIAAAFRTSPPELPQGGSTHTAECRGEAKTLYDCFHNVDDENLFEALIELCSQGIQAGRPIEFQ